MKILGLAGTNGSGKDTIAHLLRDTYGWYFAGATEMLAEELTQRGEPHERANKAALSSEWRKQYGMGAVVDKGYELYASTGKAYAGFIVGSLRHPGEADRIHEMGGQVLWVDADSEVRYKRITSSNRGRVEDNKTYEQFLVEQEAEMHGKSDDPTALKMSAVKDRADMYIVNNGADIDEFIKQVITTLTLHGSI